MVDYTEEYTYYLSRPYDTTYGDDNNALTCTDSNSKSIYGAGFGSMGNLANDTEGGGKRFTPRSCFIE